ncbi:MAG: hypothetical protein KDE53_36150, partial [Caldilineaceae bacterium]|nr:hypothetical protein [Caldilineaceae bacterium]
ELATLLLPDEVAPLGETRHLLQQKADLFRAQGHEALPAIHGINERLTAIRTAMATDFPLDEKAVVHHRQRIADQLSTIRAIEEEAVTALRDIMTT